MLHHIIVTKSLNSNAFKLIIAWSKTDLYFSSVCKAWFAFVNILDISSNTYFLSPYILLLHFFFEILL